MNNENTDFKIIGRIAKAYKNEDHTKFYITGIASGTKVDRDDERMAESIIHMFKKAIDEGIYNYEGQWSLVPLVAGHDQEWDRHLGWVVSAEINEDHDLIITAELDPLAPNAMSLFQKLNRPIEVGKPLRLGFSVGGRIHETNVEHDPVTGHDRLVFVSGSLREMTVTGFPAYAPSYLSAVTKSLARKESNAMENQDEAVVEKTADEVIITDAPDVSAEEAAVVEVEAVEKAVETEAEADVEKAAEEAEAVVEAVAEVEAVVEETVDKSNVEAATEVETDPSIADQLAVLTETIAALKSGLAEVQKSLASQAEVEEAEVEQVEKSTDATAAPTLDVELIAAAMEKALAPIVADTKQLRADLEEIASQEVDKSLSVREGEGNAPDPVESFNKRLSSGDIKTTDIIRESLIASLGGN